MYIHRKRVPHTNTSSMSGDSTTTLFYRDLGARWLHDDSRPWRPSKEKNGQKRVGGFLRCAPRIICPDWKGLGMQWTVVSVALHFPAPEQRPWFQVFSLIVQTESFLHRRRLSPFKGSGPCAGKVEFFLPTVRKPCGFLVVCRLAPRSR